MDDDGLFLKVSLRSAHNSFELVRVIEDVLAALILFDEINFDCFELIDGLDSVVPLEPFMGKNRVEDSLDIKSFVK